MNVAVSVRSDSFHAGLLSEKDINARVARDYSALISELSQRPITITAPELRRIARNTHVFVAWSASGAIIGTACLVVMDLPQGTRVLVESVVVDAGHRGHGVGHELLRGVIAKAREYGVEHISLTCNPTRADALRLYTSMGFATANTDVLRLRV